MFTMKDIIAIYLKEKRFISLFIGVVVQYVCAYIEDYCRMCVHI